jgi:hypothetical protein
MDRTQVDELVAKFRNGELSRRGFMRQATALGISVGAAGMLARTAVAQDATPEATPGASPVAGASAEVGSIAPPSREDVVAAIREEFGMTDAEVTGGQVIYGQTTDIRLPASSTRRWLPPTRLTARSRRVSLTRGRSPRMASPTRSS